MKRILTSLLLTLAYVPASGTSAAELKLPAVFSPHMVLQRDKPAPVWGWADPGEEITVTFADQTKSATADADGKWMVKLDPLPACAEPRNLAIQSENSERKAEVTDVLVGEVWLGSGQSNMAMTVSRALDFDKEKAAADLPLIRMFKESSSAAASPQALPSGEWSVCTPETVGNFSATLFFFGRVIQGQLEVPVGLINSSVGGTPIESWIAAEVQALSPELKGAMESLAKSEAAFDEAAAKARYEKALERWKEQAAQAKKAGQAVPKRPTNPVEQRQRRGGLGGLFNGKIAPLIPYALRGALWYQGEANSQTGKGILYQHQLPLLVTDWRSRWGEDFPFAWVQLPNYKRSGEDWMLVREGMLKSLRLPRSGMAITIDIGDPDNIHPANKQEVGRRLALWALGEVYGRKVDATSGPLPSGHKVLGDEIVVSFTHCEGGLEAKDGDLKGFQIAGEDRQWKPAQARIEGSQVVVSCPEVRSPVAVRYAWEANPLCSLYNAQGLPASPFRSDDWPINAQ